MTFSSETMFKVYDDDTGEYVLIKEDSEFGIIQISVSECPDVALSFVPGEQLSLIIDCLTKLNIANSD